MWRSVEQLLPKEPGLYSVRLFSGAIRRAFWTGKTWYESECHANKKRKPQTGFIRYIRYWQDEK
ncbi:hypothetical protein EV681_4548 [Advenella incenata]|uniref:Uncharacterized protein n=1 Tax=Advenella incenata TaxID=267800 RepID=A0A4Q7V5U8_9BURK|nr:hypothetical protein [Advenella incenata]RZT91194.1 hypothetical protein EV681_4548 [Advenella incenata]